MTPERRAFIGTIEARAEGDNMPTEITGVAAIINSVTDLGFAEEVILDGAFDGALEDDVRVLGNHDPNIVLGRTKAGTAKIFVKADGALGYTFTPDYQNPTHVSWVRSIMRGDVSQSSFAFTIAEGGSRWVESSKYGPMGKREITQIKNLYDVSPVTYPAYSDTSVSARDLETAKYERELIAAEESKASADVIALALARYKNY
jgi:HK97 family phage prohead protease